MPTSDIYLWMKVAQMSSVQILIFKELYLVEVHYVWHYSHLYWLKQQPVAYLHKDGEKALFI